MGLCVLLWGEVCTEVGGGVDVAAEGLAVDMEEAGDA